MLKMLLRQIKE